VFSGNVNASIGNGQPLNITIESPGDGGAPYVLAFTSSISPAFILNLRTVEATQTDPIFQVTLFGLLPQFFPGNFGLLDGNGMSSSPQVLMPQFPGAAGVTIWCLFGTGGPGPSGVESISDPYPITFTS
jgi:hypothetical protein